MALQFSLQNVLDLVKYVVTIILHRPSQFKCASTLLQPILMLRTHASLDSQGPW